MRWKDRVHWNLHTLAEKAVQAGLLNVCSRGYGATQQVIHQGFSSLTPAQRIVYLAEAVPALDEMFQRQFAAGPRGKRVMPHDPRTPAAAAVAARLNQRFALARSRARSARRRAPALPRRCTFGQQFQRNGVVLQTEPDSEDRDSGGLRIGASGTQLGVHLGAQCPRRRRGPVSAKPAICDVAESGIARISQRSEGIG